jgi:formylmethanofuran dehydrogenase subunit D
MSMEMEMVTTPPPNYGWAPSGGSGGLGSGISMVKPKSGKSVTATGLVDNNTWLHPSGNNALGEHEASSSKSSKSIGIIAVPINSQDTNDQGIIHVPYGIKVTSKTGKAAYSNAQVIMVSKSAKSAATMSYSSGEGEALSGIKVTSKTGKGSYKYYANDSQVIMVSKSAKSEYAMSVSDQGIIAVPNGLKVDSKTGKASYLNDGQVVISSKSAKSDLMSYQYLDEGTISGVKVATKTSKKSSKSVKIGMEHVVMSVNYTSEDPSYIAKSAKSLSNANTGVKALATKAGKSEHLMSIDQSEHPTIGPKSSKGTKSISNLSMDTGEVWMVSKSAKSSTKSSKSTIDQDTIIITPEEAGLPFRAKSSKSIPLRQVHNMNMPTDSSMPIQVSPSSNLSKRVQVKKEAIVQKDGTILTLGEYKKEAVVQEDGTTMTLEEYNAMYKPPQRQSGAETTLIRQLCVMTSFVVAGYLM